jgi:hypothetical protein
MPLKYYTAGSPIFQKNARDAQRGQFQALLDDLFYDAPSVYTIQEEISFFSGSWVNVDVRINQALDRQTGNKLGDDFKLILFKDLDHDAGLGHKYSFDSNTWLTVNLENYKGLARTSTIRRCNAILRWVDENGNSYSEPCSIDYELNRSRDEIGAKSVVTPQGYVDVYAQLNAHTKLIKGNQRFIFGPSENRIAFQVFGNGVRNFLNEQTADDSTCKLVVLTMGANQVNTDTDDVTNGIADYYKNVFALSLSPSAIAAQVGDTSQITPILTWNGDVSSKAISYRTSASTVASVSASGLVAMVASGTATITGYMTDNVGVTDTTAVTVSASAALTYEIRIDPLTTYVYEGETQAYTAYLYQDGVAQADVFVFTVADADVPTDHYALSVLGNNSFSVQNLQFYLDDPLSVICTTGSRTKQVDIYLRGVY